jgi:hypothetical protein
LVFILFDVASTADIKEQQIKREDYLQRSTGKNYRGAGDGLTDSMKQPLEARTVS